MTASILRQDPNTKKVQINAYLFEHGQTVRKFSGNPLCQATKRHSKDKSKVRGDFWHDFC